MKNLISIFCIIVFLLLDLISCASTKKITEPVDFPLLKENPVFNISGNNIKIQAENFFISDSDGARILHDNNADEGFCVQLKDKSVYISSDFVLSKGFWKILLCEKASINGKCNFILSLNDFLYKVKPSDPPLGTWELTTRTPCYYNAEENQTVRITIMPDFKNQYLTSGPKIDYILFIKR